MAAVGLGRQAQGSSLPFRVALKPPDVAAAEGLDKIVTLSLIQTRRPSSIVADTISFAVLSEDVFKDTATASYLQTFFMDIFVLSIISVPDIHPNRLWCC